VAAPTVAHGVECEVDAALAPAPRLPLKDRQNDGGVRFPLLVGLDLLLLIGHSNLRPDNTAPPVPCQGKSNILVDSQGARSYYLGMRNTHADQIAAIEAQRARQPIGTALLDTLGAACDAQSTPEGREPIERAIIAVSGHLASQPGDVTEAEAMSFLASVGLVPEGTEPYAVIVDGARVGVIAAKNKYHAANKARKNFGLSVAEYRRGARGHEIHGARPSLSPDGAFPAPERLHSECMGSGCPKCHGTGLRPPESHQEPQKAHALGLERREHPSWPVRAVCACGWRGTWHRDETGTRVGSRAHAKAWGLS